MRRLILVALALVAGVVLGWFLHGVFQEDGEFSLGGGGDTTTTTTTSTTTPTSTVPVVAQPPIGATLETVRERGTLSWCGVNTDLPGFAVEDDVGNWFGFDVDFCRAVAAAVLGDAGAVEFIGLTSGERFPALQSGEIDVLFRNTTWTQGRDAELFAEGSFDFGPTIFYDGQQLLGRSPPFTTESALSDLDGAVVCVNEATTTEANIEEQRILSGADFEVIATQTFDGARFRFERGECDALTGDGSALVSARQRGEPGDETWVIFPTNPISREPLGPAFRAGDSQWADIVTWTVYATIIADEKGVTSVNVDEIRETTTDAETLRLLGGEGERQTDLRVAADAFYQVIKQVGSYGEIFERNLSPVGIAREGTLNAGVDEFGLITAPPAR